MAAKFSIQRSAKNLGANILIGAGPTLAQIEPLRRRVVGKYEKQILSGLEKARSDPDTLPGVAEDKAAMGLAILSSIERALVQNRVSKATMRAGIKVLAQTLLLKERDLSIEDRFKAEHGWRAPSFLLVSPSKACNLRCTGCYADSGKNTEKLDWDTVDRLITEAKTLWGAHLFAISGGEPFAYRSGRKGILDIVEKHSDCIFLTYTNGTLITPEIGQRLARAGNMLLAISVEGWKERTDARRGEGVFDRVLETMKLLRQEGAPFGISLTATRQNAEEILSDEFIDFFMEQGALFGWIFQYMPIGRSYTLDLMPTPEQRVWMWRRSWEIVRKKRMFLADFWNSGTACDGCLSAGGHGAGGYFYVDWNGTVSPCVFFPYSPINIKDVYGHGRNLNDMWGEPFFRAVRQWQLDYKLKGGNGLAPCPLRDHHTEMRRIILQHEPNPSDENAAAALLDPDYARGLAAYDEALEHLTGPIWETRYMRRPASGADGFAPLPDIPKPQEATVTEREDAAAR